MLNFKLWLEIHQKLFPWATEESPVDPNIKRFKNLDNYIKNKTKNSKKTEVAAEKLINEYPNPNREQIIQLLPAYITLPSKNYPNGQIRSERYIAFVHLKTINNVNPNEPYYDRPRHRILAYYTLQNKNFSKDQVFGYFDRPIGGISFIGNDIDVVWVDQNWRGNYDNFSLYKELRNFAKLRGAVDLKPNDELTSKSFRIAQAKYDWKRAGRN